MADLLKDHMFAAHAVASCGSITLSSSFTHPLDTLKTLLQVGAGSTQQVGFRQVVDRVRSLSGFPGLYNGFSWSVLGSISGMSARFGVYEIITAFFKDHCRLQFQTILQHHICVTLIVSFKLVDGREDNYVYVSEALLAGMASGSVEAVLCTPFERLKLRKQVSSASPIRTMSSMQVMHNSTSVASRLLPGYTPNVSALNSTVGILTTLSFKYSDLVGALKQYPWMLTGSGRPPLASEVKRPLDIISLEGWSALWRGLRSGIAHDSVFGGSSFI